MKKHATMLQGMVTVAEARMNGDNSPETLAAWAKQLEIGREFMRNESSCPVVEALLNFYILQNRREAGFFRRITAEAANEVGIRAINGANKFIEELNKLAAIHEARVVVIPVGNEQAERALKQRAKSLGKSLAGHGFSLSHCQVLGMIASAEGHGAYQSLKTALKPFVPAFCPHCGAAGTLEQVGNVFCEQGEWDGKHYAAEGSGAQYQCSSCKGQFTDWCGVEDVTSTVEPRQKESKSEKAVFNIVLRYGDNLESFPTVDRANAYLARNHFCDEAFGEDEDCKMVKEFDASTNVLLEI